MATREQRSEALVGLFLFIGLAFLGGLILQFGRLGDRFRGTYTLSVVWDDASGLIKGSDIRMGGAKIGRVAERPALNDQLKVEVSLLIDERVKIPSGSRFQIASATLLGDKLVVITPPDQAPGTFIEAGTHLTGAPPAGLDALQNDAEAFTHQARQMIGQAEHALKNLDGAVTDVRSATAGLNQLIDKLNTRILSDANLASFDRSIADLGDTLASLKEAGNRLGPTVDEAREAIGSIKEAAEGARTTLAKADQKLDQLGPALDEVPAAVRSLGKVADKAGSALESAQGGEGLLGTLAYDREVSTDARSFIANLRRYGILRYRNADEPPAPDPRNRFRGQRR